MPEEQLIVKQTATGYWVVERDGLEVSGAVTRKGAEAERELLRRLRAREPQLRSPGSRRPRASTPDRA